MGKDLRGKELGAGLSQRKDGRFCARFTNRFGKRQCVYATTIKDVKIKMRNAMAEDTLFLSVSKEVTMDRWFSVWFEVYKQATVRPNTLREYKDKYERFIQPQLGRMKLTDIKKMHVQKIINQMHAEGYSYETQNKVRVIIIDLCNRAIEDRCLVVNPGSGVRVIGKKKAEARRALSKEEQIEFFKFAEHSFYYNAFVVECNTGMRPGELFGLKEEDVDLESKVIHIRRTLVYQKYLTDTKKTFHEEDPKTQQSLRDIPLNQKAVEYLKRQIKLKRILSVKYHTDCPYLFCTTLNTPIESQIYKDAIDAVVKNINFFRLQGDYFPYFSGHVLRHTFATRCFEAGIPPKVVQKYLGHASLKMTMDLYTHVMPEIASDEIEKIADICSPDKETGDGDLLDFTAEAKKRMA